MVYWYASDDLIKFSFFTGRTWGCSDFLTWSKWGRWCRWAPHRRSGHSVEKITRCPSKGVSIHDFAWLLGDDICQTKEDSSSFLLLRTCAGLLVLPLYAGLPRTDQVRKLRVKLRTDPLSLYYIESWSCFSWPMQFFIYQNSVNSNFLTLGFIFLSWIEFPFGKLSILISEDLYLRLICMFLNNEYIIQLQCSTKFKREKVSWIKNAWYYRNNILGESWFLIQVSLIDVGGNCSGNCIQACRERNQKGYCGHKYCRDFSHDSS